jgi:hypothetical protein
MVVHAETATACESDEEETAGRSAESREVTLFGRGKEGLGGIGRWLGEVRASTGHLLTFDSCGGDKSRRAEEGDGERRTFFGGRASEG